MRRVSHLDIYVVVAGVAPKAFRQLASEQHRVGLVGDDAGIDSLLRDRRDKLIKFIVGHRVPLASRPRLTNNCHAPSRPGVSLVFASATHAEPSKVTTLPRSYSCARWCVP